MKHILLVDDNLLNLKLAANLLKEYYSVSTAKSGVEALAFCKENALDLILLDVDMPEMDGFETIKRLKADPHTCKIPVIFLTAYSSSEIETRGFEYGAVDFIAKPFAKSSMLHRIATHLQLYTYQQHLEEVVEKLEDSMVMSLCKIIGYRDYETGEHVERTKKYVKLLAEELQRENQFSDILDEGYVVKLVKSASLHDIGKIGISDAILLKPEQLTPLECEKMKCHTIIGAEILEKIIEITPSRNYLNIAKEIAGSHHEWYDGSGYPYGLVGEDIPLSGRIMAVADVYDALISHRIYREAMSHEMACDIINMGSRKQFDPIIVDAFNNIKDEFYNVAQLIKGTEQDIERDLNIQSKN